MDIKERLARYGIVPNKALGQNFLVDESAVQTIIESAAIDDRNVLEIGAGMGALTEVINARAAKTLVVEIDRSMVDVLSSRTWEKPDTLKIINADFLKVKDTVIDAELEGGFCVVANLPYYVTTPISMKLLRSGLEIESMTLMMQREAAEHFTAKPGTKQYSPLALLTEYLFDVETVLELSPASYYPQPDVYSKVLHFSSVGSDISRVKNLAHVLNCAFSMRRKTIQNNLCTLGISKQQAGELLDSCGIDRSARAEQLNLPDFLKIEEMYRESRVN